MRFLIRNPLVIIAGLLVASCLAAQIHNPIEYGAVADSRADSTEAFQAAIDAAGSSGGGKVVVSGGTYLVGPLFLKSNIEFEITAGATLLFKDDIEECPTVYGRWEGIDRIVYASLFNGRGLQNVSIYGNGLIDGQGKVWWDGAVETLAMRKRLGIKGREPDEPEGAPLKYPRPRVINLYECEDILIRDLSIINSPSWTIHPVYCKKVTVDNISIKQPYESPNTDGINPDSCQHVTISNCKIDVGDDCITIKSGYNEHGRRVGIPCENIAVVNCVFQHGRGGVVVGSEMSGDVRNIVVSNCIFDGTHRGLRIKTQRGRGGVVENFQASNLVMRNITDLAFSITMGYVGADISGFEPVTESTPKIRNIQWSDVIMTGVNQVAGVIGLPEMPVEEIIFRDIIVTSAGKGMELLNMDGLVIQDVQINVDSGPCFVLINVSDADLIGIHSENPIRETPIIEVENSFLFIDQAKTYKDTDIFLSVKDTASEVTMGNNRLDQATVVKQRK